MINYPKFLKHILILIFTYVIVGAQYKSSPDLDACTSIMVGKQASEDGSVIVGHTCDAYYRTWLNFIPGATHTEGSKRKVYWGKLNTETPWDTRGVVEKGEIPQVAETYKYLNVAYPCLNEKQLAMGETTFGGKEELRNDEGMFLIEELQSIALERCTTAREAIELMGKLVAEYGYGDWGECLTIADKNEVWQFEIMGAGPFDLGAVWAAQRIPDDHVGISANVCRIGELDLNNSDFYMASENVFRVAEELGYWSPDSGEPFKFWKAYSGEKPFAIRDYFVLNSFAPSLNLKYDSDELPFSVKPDKKVTLQKVFDLYRETYENTEYDMTKDMLVTKNEKDIYNEDLEKGDLVKSSVANPWLDKQTIKMLNAIKPGFMEYQRTVAVAKCSYSQVVQLRGWLPDEVGGVAWFSFDNPAMTPRIPIFIGAESLPESFYISGRNGYREDAASWAFMPTARLATLRWDKAREYIEPAIKEFETREFQDVADIEQHSQRILSKDPSKMSEVKEFLTHYTNSMAHASMSKWKELEKILWGFFILGF